MEQDTKYWKDRSERRILNAEKNAAEMLKDIKKLYSDTIDRINKDIDAFYGRYSTETGLSIEEVRKLLTPEELKKFRAEAEKYYAELAKYPYDHTYREKLKNQVYLTTTKEGRKLYSLRRNVSRLDYIKMQMQNAIETMYAKENQAFTKSMSKTYEESYMRSVFDTQQATGIFQSFNALNKPIIEKAVQERWLGENYSDRIWSDKNKLINTLETTFSQDVALGKNPREIARDIKKATGVKYSNCKRLARTEFNHIANQATKDSYKNTAGLDKYKFVATLDNRTSTICAENDGKIYLVSEAVEGINYPPLHPSCRSTTIPYLEDIDYSKMERIAKDETGKSYYVPSTLSYKDWISSLSENDGKMFIVDKKMSEQHTQDKEQFSRYKNLAKQMNKTEYKDLFEGLPSKLSDFQRIKYTEPEKWEIYKNNAKIARNYLKN